MRSLLLPTGNFGKQARDYRDRPDVSTSCVDAGGPVFRHSPGIPPAAGRQTVALSPPAAGSPQGRVKAPVEEAFGSGKKTHARLAD
ncbi:MAG: hypothetical protein MI861_21505 [Pirellulales bacterium]|nr:hypothetical protein [Pirellulales bacterium]